MSARSLFDAVAGMGVGMGVGIGAGPRGGRRTGVIATTLAMLGLSIVVVGGWAAQALAESDSAPIVLAQEGGTEPRELEPRYEPAPPGTPGPYNEQEHDIYTTDYLFAMTRGVAGSTMVPALKVPLFLFTIPLDLVFLPFEAIGGFF